MGALFTAASTQYLVNSAPAVTTMPFTVGMWFYNSAATLRTLWSLCATANTTNGYRIDNNGGTPAGITATSYGSATGTATATPTQGVGAIKWGFCVCRFISASSRRVSAINHLSEIGHGTNITASTVTSPAQMFIGAKGGSSIAQPWDGFLAEFWMTNTDIQPDGLQLSNETLRQLAYRGPFSIPSVRSSLVDYRSMRQGIGSETDISSDYFYGSTIRPTWVNTNGVLRGRHVEFLSPNYVGPGDFTRNAVV